MKEKTYIFNFYINLLNWFTIIY